LEEPLRDEKKEEGEDVKRARDGGRGLAERVEPMTGDDTGDD
jgi:hypothetical protein